MPTHRAPDARSMTKQDPPEDDDNNRTLENVVLLGFFVVLVAAGAWLLTTMADVRKGLDCSVQGRRNCGTIEMPERFR